VSSLRDRTASRQQRQLVELLEIERIIHDPAVAVAFRTVPRHLFLPGVPLEEVYRDIAIPTKRIDGIPVSSSSQPAMMAEMLQQLDVRLGQRVLEIGAGTGYNAALLASLVGEGGHVTTLDIDDDLVTSAREHLAAAGFSRVQTVCADGGLGYAPEAPYDRIILTVGAWDICAAWFEQLAPAGRLLLPLSLRGPQKSVAFVWEEGHLRSDSIRDCSFVRLRGAFAGPDHLVQLGPEPGLYLFTEGQAPPKPDGLYRSLVAGNRDVPTGLHVRPQEVWSGFLLWLALHDSRICALRAVEPVAERGFIPDLMATKQTEGSCHTIGLCEGQTVAVLAFSHRTLGELLVRTSGPDDTLGHRVAEHLAAWHAAGRPSTEELTLHAYPQGMSYLAREDDVVLPGRSSTLVLTWGPSPPGRFPAA
jgi:protein-L-isoaspartate(D-aspartate) O-methyltransferase